MPADHGSVPPYSEERWGGHYRDLRGGMRVQQSKVQRCIKDVQCGRVRDREIEVECEVIMCVSFQFVRLGERLRYVSKR